MTLRQVDRPLRKDVRFLGELLGAAIAEQEGYDVLELEERIRRLAIARRRGPREERQAARRELVEALSGLPEAKVEPILRAFSVYFQLVNLAEQHHRVRRARAHATSGEPVPQRGSLKAVLLEARRRGIGAEKVREAIRALEVTLTFTAHPTQAMRRTVLEKLYRIAHALEDRDRCSQTPTEQRESRLRIREEITALWQTDELRRERPTVGDEVKNVLWYLEEILWDALPRLSHALAEAFESAFGEPLGFTPAPVRLHSWVGGDMDGHPGVTPEVLEDAIRAYRNRGVRKLLEAVGQLGSALSQSSRRVTVPRALLDSIAEDATRMPDVAASQGPRTEGEPWRRKLRFIEARLLATLREGERLRGQRPGGPMHVVPVYRGAEELAADLKLVADTLNEARGHRAGERQVRALLLRVETLGLQAAELELRVPADDARAAVRALEKNEKPAGGAARLLETLERIAQLQHEGGERSCRTLILSMAGSADDVKAALACARARGLWDEARGCATVDVVPLFETLQALESSADILKALFSDPDYLRHVRARGVQEVMVGYSDSGKEVGLLAASGALWRAQRRLPAIAREAGVALRLFHGRGESVARGGGPAQQAILALPPGSVSGRYKATEQGEALDHKYARPELAMRTLELIVGGALLHSVDGQDTLGAADESRFEAAYARLSELGRGAYRSLVWEEPSFPELFRAVTPVEEIAELPMGSRPAKRSAGGLEALRAIPWVFAWTQNRAILPGWYGVGSALERFAGEAEGHAGLLAEMYARWPFFRAVIDNVEMVLAKSDLRVAERYCAALAPESLWPLWERIVEEHERTIAWVKRIAGRRQLLENNPSLQRSIALRNPYVDPMSFLQVELLGQKRAGKTTNDRALLITLSGIASGMRNTG